MAIWVFFYRAYDITTTADLHWDLELFPKLSTYTHSFIQYLLNAYHQEISENWSFKEEGWRNDSMVYGLHCMWEVLGAKHSTVINK